MAKSIIPGDRKRQCYICGKRCTTHVHHMIPGAGKEMSEAYGLKVNLCPECHTALHDRSVYYRQIKQFAEIQFLMHHPYTLWLQEFGKNYLVGNIGPFPFYGSINEFEH